MTFNYSFWNYHEKEGRRRRKKGLVSFETKHEMKNNVKKVKTKLTQLFCN